MSGFRRVTGGSTVDTIEYRNFNAVVTSLGIVLAAMVFWYLLLVVASQLAAVAGDFIDAAVGWVLEEF